MKKVTTLLLAAVLLAGMLPRRAAAVDLNLNAKSALLMDVATGTVLYEKECHERLAPASVTKVMTMLLIMEALDDGRIHLDDQVTASETAAAKGGSQIYLKAGETMPVSDMLKSIAGTGDGGHPFRQLHRVGRQQGSREPPHQRL